jgi:predicted dehydrogenase
VVRQDKIIKRVVIVGSGFMSHEYLKVLETFNNLEILIVGNREINPELRSGVLKRYLYLTGGFNNNINKVKKFNPHLIIIAASVISLTEIIIDCIKNNFQLILLEKPGFSSPKDLEKIKNYLIKSNTKILLAFNRRFYESVIKLKNLIMTDKILSGKFSFSERIWHLNKISKNEKELAIWYYVNSLHVIDLFFHICGDPIMINSNSSLKHKWKNNKTIYVGSGVTNKEVYFSYHSNWNAPDNWSIELFTEKKAYLLNPLEELRVKKLGENNYNKIKLNSENFKPGLYNQVNSIINFDFSYFKTLDEQIYDMENIYNKL